MPFMSLVTLEVGIDMIRMCDIHDNFGVESR